MEIPFLAAFFLLFAFTAKPSSSCFNSQPVLDIDGDPLRTGTSYYVEAAIWSWGGGLSLAKGRNMTCPLDVVLEYDETNPGRPVMFLPADVSHTSNDTKSVIYQSTDLNIRFTSAPITCNEPTVWRVDDYDSSTGQWFISTNGVEGEPGAHTLRNWFKIEQVEGVDPALEGSYRIVYCPYVCESCVHLCSKVGLFNQIGGSIQRLALSNDQEFWLMFLKAGDQRLIRQKWMV